MGFAPNPNDHSFQFNHFNAPNPHSDPFGPPQAASNQVKRPSKRRKRSHRSHVSTQHASSLTQDGDEDFKFKDVSEIFQNDANDVERIRREEQEVKELSEMYETVYLTKPKRFEHDAIAEIVTKMQAFIPKEHWDEVAKANEERTQSNDEDSKSDTKLCGVCFCEYDDDEGKLIVMQEHCDHAMICKSCFVQHLKVKIKDDDITPWIPCPAENCKAPVSCRLLLDYVELENLYQFAAAFIRKHLARNSNWVRCGTSKCEFGWMILDKDTSKQHKLRCAACKKKQSVCKDPMRNDEGFDELIKSGVLRLCPKCSLPTMKDKGMCNVMHCGKCGIYWNWKTRETGTSSSQLKNKARRNGTLWEPGELRYQQELQRTNLPEFKRLLERNGIKYDPNYVRGTR